MALLFPLSGCAISSSVNSLSNSSDSVSRFFGSVSGSLKSISRSLGSLSRSISKSSKGKKAAPEEAYRNDIRSYTALFVRSGGTEEEYLHALSEIASRHGLSQWESEAVTYTAMGEGLRRGGVDRPRFQAFLRDLRQDSGVSEELIGEIRRGYEIL